MPRENNSQILGTPLLCLPTECSNTAFWSSSGIINIKQFSNQVLCNQLTLSSCFEAMTAQKIYLYRLVSLCKNKFCQGSLLPILKSSEKYLSCNAPLSSNKVCRSLHIETKNIIAPVPNVIIYEYRIN